MLGPEVIGYSNNCVLFCPWAVYRNNAPIGHYQPGSFLDDCNKESCKSCTFIDSPMMKIMDKDNNHMMTIMKKDNPFTRIPLLKNLGPPLNLVFGQAFDLFYFCMDNNIIVVTEKIFDKEKGENKTEVGEVLMVYKVKPFFKFEINPTGPPCYMDRIMTRFTVKLNMSYTHMLPTIMLFPLMQAGRLEPTCKQCAMNVVPPASGSMFDCGRYTKVRRFTFEQMLNKMGSGAPPAPETTDDRYPVVFEWDSKSGGRRLDGDRSYSPDRSDPWVIAEQMAAEQMKRD